MDYEVKHVLKNYDNYVKIVEELKNKKREIAANQLKTGGSVTQPPQTSTKSADFNVEGGAGPGEVTSHSHTYTPPFGAVVMIIKT